MFDFRTSPHHKLFSFLCGSLLFLTLSFVGVGQSRIV